MNPLLTHVNPAAIRQIVIGGERIEVTDFTAFDDGTYTAIAGSARVYGFISKIDYVVTD
jgi:hypothetical protein